MIYTVYFATGRGSPEDRVQRILEYHGWQGVLAHEGDTDALNENFGPLPRGGTEIAQLERIRRECVDKYVARGGLTPGDVVKLGRAHWLYTGIPREGGFEHLGRKEYLTQIEEGLALGWA